MNDISIDSIQVVSSAVMVRNLIQYLKSKGMSLSSIEVTAMSFVLNFLLTFLMQLALSMSQSGNVTLAATKGLAAMVFSAVYHDWNSKGVSEVNILTPAPQNKMDEVARTATTPDEPNDQAKG
jgi:hypothetical protein